MTQRRSFTRTVLGYFSPEAQSVELNPGDRLRLSGKGLRVSAQHAPFTIEMGKQIVHLYPDLPMNSGSRKPPYDYLLIDPDIYFSGIAHFTRLRPGETLKIDHRTEFQKLVFSQPRHAFRRHLQIRHEGESFVFSDPISELGTYLTRLEGAAEKNRLHAYRQSKLVRLREIFGDPVELQEPDEALVTIREVNRILRSDSYRRLDSNENSGSLLELPAYITPILVGDLHAQINNLLTLLVSGSFLDCLERGEAALIFLGDAIHPEDKHELEEMNSSMLIMDLILKLKLRFPKRVFFILGNHDSFSPDVMKAGVAQSAIWKRKLVEKRGEEYRQEMELFYRQSPFVVISPDFIACHAGPPRSPVSVDKLVEARQFPELHHELTWNRIKSKNWPLGYTRTDIKRLRKSLNLEDDLPFIVSHYPQDRDGTLWLNIDRIPQHHILYSARPDRVAVFTRVKGQMVPQIYPTESLLELLGPES